MVCYHIIVHGHVQGVGFRFYSYQNAIENNIQGWVKNNYDGTVEMEIEGDIKDITKFIAAVKKGASFSTVKHLDIKKTKDLKGYKSFEIKY